MNGFNRRWISWLLHKAEMQQVQRPLTRFKWLNLSAHARQLPKDTSENYMGILNFRPFFFSVQYLRISMPLIKTLQQDFSFFFNSRRETGVIGSRLAAWHATDVWNWKQIKRFQRFNQRVHPVIFDSFLAGKVRASRLKWTPERWQWKEL